jgi:curli biogenesis system outer membrane secretion channel CsgG
MKIINQQIIINFIVALLGATMMFGCGTTRTEKYTADFEKKQSIQVVSDYDGKPIPVQVLSIGISDNVLTSYPILKEKNVGLGVTNIALDYLEGTNRFEFTEDKEEIKLKMVKQFQASAKGFTENKLDGKGKIKLAKYFVYIEVYDFSVSEDEVVKIKGESKTTQTTRLGLQVKFVDAETGEVLVGSGLGEASTIKTVSILDGIDDSPVKFNQSTIGITTKKSLETASSRIVSRMIKKGIFKN